MSYKGGIGQNRLRVKASTYLLYNKLDFNVSLNETEYWAYALSYMSLSGTDNSLWT